MRNMQEKEYTLMKVTTKTHTFLSYPEHLIDQVNETDWNAIEADEEDYVLVDENNKKIINSYELEELLTELNNA